MPAKGAVHATMILPNKPKPQLTFCMKLKKQGSILKYGRLLASIAGLSLATHLEATVSYLGVAAGDASSQEATLWTRAVDDVSNPVALTTQVATNPAFSGTVLAYPVNTDTNKDYTAKVQATGLLPGTRYYYRFTDGSSNSLTGTFKTAPAANAAAAVSFAFSGDCDGLIRPYALASQVPAKNLDFFMFDGDTIYETASSGSVAVTSTGTIPGPTSTGATSNQLSVDFSRKYQEQFLLVNAGGKTACNPSSQARATIRPTTTTNWATSNISTAVRPQAARSGV